MAQLLDVPVNTLSRWETGATTPDAHALAAITSICADRGVQSVSFFKESESSLGDGSPRTKLALVWDFQNLARKAADVSEDIRYLTGYFDLLHPMTKASRTMKAYVGYMHEAARVQFEGSGIEIGAALWNADKEVVAFIAETCAKRPSRQVLYLVADDGDYADVLREHRSRGVDVYLVGSEKCSDRLTRSVEPGNFVPFDRPYVVVEAMNVLRTLLGKALSKSEIGNEIKAALDEDHIYPQDAGFSSRNPYGSLLGWLQLKGVLLLKESARGTATVALPGRTRQEA